MCFPLRPSPFMFHLMCFGRTVVDACYLTTKRLYGKKETQEKYVTYILRKPHGANCVESGSGRFFGVTVRDVARIIIGCRRVAAALPRL